MGIMASDVRLALRGFRDWCDALGVEFVLPENRVGYYVARVQSSVAAINHFKYPTVSIPTAGCRGHVAG